MSQKQRSTNPHATDAKGPSLSQQYGGIHKGGWVDRVPASWVPYIQLARLSPPVALLLIFFPHVFGALHAAAHASGSPVAPSCALLLAGSFFFSNAAHAWNDIVDAPLDARVARTRSRPVVRGAVSRRAALVFAASQACVAALFLVLPSPPAAVKAAVPTVLGTAYYPWAKRHTHFPQLVLGFCLSWGVIVGSASVGGGAEVDYRPWEDRAALLLTLSSGLWTFVYDTVYAHQDILDDERAGVKSVGLLFKSHTKSLLSVVLLLMGASLVSYGKLTHASFAYYIITAGGSISSLGVMIFRVDLKDQKSCWWWFSRGFWFPAVFITAGLLLEYVLVLTNYALYIL
ncbi:UbiA prenyltransferase [Hypoxylon sp. FL1284]|nr:UbiA prenyltransferase [Hypoxylon sp. FL1284]